ncbi:MAG: hypothetical protein ACREMQ_21065 [Longimicrobiales bacterium]
MRSFKRWTALAVAALFTSCEGGGPADPEPGPPDLSRNVSIQGTLDYDRIDIPAGVTVTVTGPLVLNSSGDVAVRGTLAGDCVAITINGDAGVLVGGAIRNACGTLPAQGPPPALTIIGTGDMNFDGAAIETSGDLEIKNDPALTEAIFATPPASGAGSGAGGGSARAVTLSLRNSRFVALPDRAPNGQDGQNGTNGTDASNWRLMMRGDLILGGGNLIQGQSGGHGGNGTHDGAPASSQGGDGGDGGRISVLATGQLTIGGATNLITSGSGGNGGSATSNAGAGAAARAPDANATGGNGGDPGLVRLEGQRGLSSNASLSVTVGNGGTGGTATANAADGQSAVCVGGKAQSGGHADARAGRGGSSPDRRLSEGGNATVSAPPTVQGGNGGAGGKAVSKAGNGAAGRDCDTCRDGGDGGNFQARGGPGGAARVRNLDGTLIGRGGNGGASEHRGGNGGNGFDCCVPTPRPGGDGGKGGNAMGGDGLAGSGRTNGLSMGVTIASGNGGDGGDGLSSPGDGGDGGIDNTVAIGPKAPGTDNFQPGDDGAPCAPAPPSGSSIAGNYTLSGSRVSQTGPCSSSPSITNANLVIEFDGTNVIVNSTLRVTGPYNAQTGQWQGSATSPANTAGNRTREGFAGIWKNVNGQIRFDGTVTFGLLDAGGGVICSATYLIVFMKK